MAELIDRQALKVKLLPRLYLRFHGEDECLCDMIDQLPAVDAVSRGVYEQIKWERDIAMSQLEEHGIAFGANMKEAT